MRRKTPHVADLTTLLALFNNLLDALQFATKVITSNMSYFKGNAPNPMGCRAMGRLFASYGL